ncbi:MAG: penicillin acylase family protein [Candidatus Dormibacteria bacterium]
MLKRRGERWALGILVVISLFGLAPVPGSAAPGGPTATIRRTAHGIPHIVASDFAGIGYGYGYAFASDNICIIADQYVTVDAQRSRYFGPSASWTFVGNGFSANNLNSDFFFQQVIDDRRIEKLLSLPPPLGPRQEIKDGVRGYTAGYNRYLADTGTGGISDPTCAGKPWVHPITEIEVYRRFYELALLASSGVAIDGIGGAAPTAGACSPSQLSQAAPTPLADGLEERLHLDIGSNAIALGSAATENGHGMLLGNPHFPWRGSERFYQAQLTIPGVMNVTGASLFGVPIILIGHTDTMAWSHTVSTAFRFTPYQLTLVPGLPTSYLVDGIPEAMTARTMTVQALQPDGSIRPQSRTLYRSRWGAMVTGLVGLPLPWCGSTGFSLADANEGNFRYVNHFLETNLAHSSREELEVLKRNQGVPWVNTIVSDNRGEALYADISVVPNVPNSLVTSCATAAGQATFAYLRLPILDGSRAACAWRSDPDAVVPGIFGPANLPFLFRSDYTENSNNSYWLSNPRERLEGFATIIGDERKARSLRTRVGLTMLEEALYGLNGKPATRFTRQQLQDLVFSDRQYGGELARDGAVTMCRAFPGGRAPTSSGTPVAVGNACDVLAAWDLHEDLVSKGAVFWRAFWTPTIKLAGGPWVNQFNNADPISTPNTLNTADPRVQQAFGDAVSTLKTSGIPLEATLGPYQYAQKGAERIPIHGGRGDPEGDFNAINVGPLGSAADGFGNVPHGSSFVQVVSFNGTPCPDAQTILTYSESANPLSPYYADQTRMYSRKQWVPDLFCEAQIMADRHLTQVRVSEPVTPTPPALPNTSRSLPKPLLLAAFLLVVSVVALGRRRVSGGR